MKEVKKITSKKMLKSSNLEMHITKSLWNNARSLNNVNKLIAKKFNKSLKNIKRP